MKSKKKLIEEIEASDCKYITYGDCGCTLKEEAIRDILDMSTAQYLDIIGEGLFYTETSCSFYVSQKGF